MSTGRARQFQEASNSIVASMKRGINQHSFRSHTETLIFQNTPQVGRANRLEPGWQYHLWRIAGRRVAGADRSILQPRILCLVTPSLNLGPGACINNVLGEICTSNAGLE